MDALRLASLLSSRLCHDVVGPASAVVNGLELIELEGDQSGEAMALVATSAALITGRLQLYRAAYGVAAGLTFPDARKAAAAFFAHGKVALDWPDTAPPGALPPAAPKILLNMLLLGVELLGRGGRLGVALGDARLDVSARGELTRTDELALLGSGDTQDGAITPRNVQPYYLGRLAAAAGGRVAVATAVPGEVGIAVDF